MKKAASFLTKHRYIIASVMIVLTIVCVALAFTVPINRDRTKYLADESRMKQGLAIMESSFPETILPDPGDGIRSCSELTISGRNPGLQDAIRSPVHPRFSRVFRDLKRAP